MYCEAKKVNVWKITRRLGALRPLFPDVGLSGLAILLSGCIALIVGFNTTRAQKKVPISNLAKERVQQTQVQPVDRQTMPDLVGPKLTFEQALLELKSRDRAVNKRMDNFNEEVPSGIVYDQDPDAGTPLSSDSQIVLYVSKGKSPSAPNLTSDVSVEMTLVTKGPFVEGQQIDYSVTVKNLGETPATNVKVVNAPVNLKIDRVSGGCSQVSSCEIPSIPPGGSVPVAISATIVNAGDFNNVITVKAAESDANPTNNTDYADNGGIVGSHNVAPTPTVTPTPDPDRFPWWIVVLGTAGGFVSGGILTSAIWWMMRPETLPGPTAGPAPPPPPFPPIDARVSLEPGHASIDDLNITLPALHISVSLDSGTFVFDGPVPIIRREVRND